MDRIPHQSDAYHREQTCREEPLLVEERQDNRPGQHSENRHHREDDERRHPQEPAVDVAQARVVVLYRAQSRIGHPLYHRRQRLRRQFGKSVCPGVESQVGGLEHLAYHQLEDVGIERVDQAAQGEFRPEAEQFAERLPRIQPRRTPLRLKPQRRGVDRDVRHVQPYDRPDAEACVGHRDAHGSRNDRRGERGLGLRFEVDPDREQRALHDHQRVDHHAERYDAHQRCNHRLVVEPRYKRGAEKQHRVQPESHHNVEEEHRAVVGLAAVLLAYQSLGETAVDKRL